MLLDAPPLRSRMIGLLQNGIVPVSMGVTHDLQYIRSRACCTAGPQQPKPCCSMSCVAAPCCHVHLKQKQAPETSEQSHPQAAQQRQQVGTLCAGRTTSACSFGLFTANLQFVTSDMMKQFMQANYLCLAVSPGARGNLICKGLRCNTVKFCLCLQSCAAHDSRMYVSQAMLPGGDPQPS